MQAGTTVVELCETAQGQATCVERDLGWVGFHDEDVVDVWACRGECEGGCYVAGELRDTARWNAGVVQGEIVCGSEFCGCTGDGGTVADIEVAGG